MKHKLNRLANILKNTSRLKLSLLAIIILVALGYILFGGSSKTTAGTIIVKRGTVEQEVKITGNTKPFENVQLAFEQSGRIVNVSVAVGSQVGTGQIMAYLDQGELLAQLAEAQANTESEKAKLEEMQKGSRPEDIQIKQTALDTAKQDITNQYQAVSNSLNDAYIKADDAVRKQLDAMFDNDEATNVTLTFTLSNSQLKSNVESERLAASGQLDTWKKELSNLSGTTEETSLDKALQNAVTHLSFFRNFLGDVMTAVSSNSSLTASQLDTYKANVTTARTNVNTALTSINTTIQNISAQELVVKQKEADLNLTLAGNTPESIRSEEAQVKKAEAEAQTIQAQIQKTILRAPFNGIVTKEDAKVGEIASPNNPVISLISKGKLEIEANIPEVDVGKVQSGNSAIITIDAFPGETFTGKVGYIDPAETIVDGVTNFKTKIAFDKVDPRLKSGLTANVTIKTLEKNNVLIVPQYALKETTGQTSVQKKEGDRTVETAVTTGLHGQDGMVEITSGLNEGDTILSTSSPTP